MTEEGVVLKAAFNYPRTYFLRLGIRLTLSWGLGAGTIVAEEFEEPKRVDRIHLSIDGFDSQNDTDVTYYEMGRRQGRIVGRRLAATLDCTNLDLISSSHLVFSETNRHSYLYGYYQAFINALELARFQTLARCLDRSDHEVPTQQPKGYQRLHQSIQSAIRRYAGDSCQWQENHLLSCQIKADFWRQEKPESMAPLFFQEETIATYNHAGNRLYQYLHGMRLRKNQAIQEDIYAIAEKASLTNADIQKLRALVDELEEQHVQRDEYYFSISNY